MRSSEGYCDRDARALPQVEPALDPPRVPGGPGLSGLPLDDIVVVLVVSARVAGGAEATLAMTARANGAPVRSTGDCMARSVTRPAGRRATATQMLKEHAIRAARGSSTEGRFQPSASPGHPVSSFH